MRLYRSIDRVYRSQNEDGGWNWWDGPTSDPQTTAYVVLGLLEARDSGYTISQTVLDNGISYMRGNLPNIYVNAAEWQFNRYAFMLYVLARGDALQAHGCKTAATASWSRVRGKYASRSSGTVFARS